MWIFELAQSTCQDASQAIPKVEESHCLGRDMAEEEDNVCANITEEVAFFPSYGMNYMEIFHFLCHFLRKCPDVNSKKQRKYR